MQNFREFAQSVVDKKNPELSFGTSKTQFPTGFMDLDYHAGSYLTVYDDDEVALYRYDNVGVSSGSVIMVVSKSQGGKSSLSIDMAAAIIEPYVNQLVRQRALDDIFSVHKLLPKKGGKKKGDESPKNGLPCIMIIETEATMTIDYAKKVTSYTNKMANDLIEIVQCTTDIQFMEIIDRHCKYKRECMEKVPMPQLDMFGQVVMDYPPTVCIVDSITQLLIEGTDEVDSDSWAKSTSNTAGARRAIVISALNARLVAIARKYNIIFFSINHINKAPAMNGIPVKQFVGLNQGETINGGERALYLASSILRLDRRKIIGGDKSSALDFGPGVEGFISEGKWIKCKSNSRVQTSHLVYTGAAAYDRLLSGLYSAKEKDQLGKSGYNFFIPGREDVKFNFKNYREKFMENPDLITSYYDFKREMLQPCLDNQQDAKDDNTLELMREALDEARGIGAISTSEAHEFDDMFQDIT